MSDLIERQAAIDTLGEKPLAWTEGEYELGLQNQWQSDVDALKALPSAQPDLSEYSDKLWRAAYERGKKEAQADIVRCKDCKNSEHWYRDRRRCFLWSEDGVSVFDDGFCNYAKRRTDDGF